MIDGRVEVSYRRERSDKPKVLNVTPTQKLNFQADDAILSNYDVLLAVDTNTRNIRGYSCSLAAIVVGEKFFDQGRPSRAFRWFVSFCLVSAEVPIKVENFFWSVLVTDLKRDQRQAILGRIAIVVDSDFDNLPHYNTRKLPFFKEQYLPSNMTFVYATSDSGKEYVANKLIWEADRFSQVLLDHFEANPNLYPGDPWRVQSGQNDTYFEPNCLI